MAAKPSFMKFCPVVPEICRGQVHGPKKERRKRKRIIIIIIIIIIPHSILYLIGLKFFQDGCHY
jgi:hypothetical protein